MEIESSLIRQIIITLEVHEAMWLKAIMQNSFKEFESLQDRELRESFFKQLAKEV